MSGQTFDDYAALPDPGGVTKAEAVDRLLDRVVGQQISRLIEFDDANPQGGAQVGFLLRTHERPLYWAFPCPSRFAHLGYCTVWVPQWFERQMIVTRRMEHEMTADRQGEQATANPLYRRLEGEVVRGARFLDAPNEHGGQTIQFELSSAMTLNLHGLPGRAHGVASRFSANYRLQLVLPPKKSVISLGGGDPLVVRPTFLGAR